MFFVRPTRIFFPDPGDEKLCALTPVEGIPRLTPSIRITFEDLKLKYVIVLYPGTQCFPLANQVKAVPLQTFAEGVSLVRRAVMSHLGIVFSYYRFE